MNCVSSQLPVDAFIEKDRPASSPRLAYNDKLAAEALRIRGHARNAKSSPEEQARLGAEGAKAAEQVRAAEQAKSQQVRASYEQAKPKRALYIAEAESGACCRQRKEAVEEGRYPQEAKAAAKPPDTEKKANEDKLAAPIAVGRKVRIIESSSIFLVSLKPRTAPGRF